MNIVVDGLIQISRYIPHKWVSCEFVSPKELCLIAKNLVWSVIVDFSDSPKIKFLVEKQKKLW